MLTETQAPMNVVSSFVTDSCTFKTTTLQTEELAGGLRALRISKGGNRKLQGTSGFEITAAYSYKVSSNDSQPKIPGLQLANNIRDYPLTWSSAWSTSTNTLSANATVAPKEWNVISSTSSNPGSTPVYVGNNEDYMGIVIGVSIGGGLLLVFGAVFWFRRKRGSSGIGGECGGGGGGGVISPRFNSEVQRGGVQGGAGGGGGRGGFRGGGVGDMTEGREHGGGGRGGGQKDEFDEFRDRNLELLRDEFKTTVKGGGAL